MGTRRDRRVSSAAASMRREPNRPEQHCFSMADFIEEVLAPAVIERAMSLFASFRDRKRCELVQARKALTPHVFGLIESGQTDEKRLIVGALTYLKSLEARAAAAKS